MEGQKTNKRSPGCFVAVLVILAIVWVIIYFGNQYCRQGHKFDKYDAQVIAENYVKSQLKSPSTAKFCSTRECTITEEDSTWTVKGWVDAQNSFGATIRSYYTVVLTPSTIIACSIE